MLLLLLCLVLLSWLSLVFGLAGVKLWSRFRSLSAGGTVTAPDGYLPLLGFLLITIVSSYLSIFFPTGLYLKGGFVLAGGVLTFFFAAEVRAFLRRAGRKWSTLTLPSRLLAVAVVLVSVVAGVDEITLNDSIIYHSQNVEWIRQYAVVPGLGNLHGRFAFNSHFFIVSALFSVRWGEQFILYPVNSFLFLLLAAHLIRRLDGVPRSAPWFSRVLHLSLLLLTSFHFLPELGSPSTDLITSMLVLFAFLVFLEMAPQTRTDQFTPLLLALLIFTAATFKLSAIFVSVLLLYFLWPLRRARVAPLILAGLAVLLPFFIRNIILSGYLVYPLPEVDLFEVEWKIPKEQAVFEKKLITGWARLDEKAGVPEAEAVAMADQGLRDWFGPWLSNFGLKWRIIFVFNLLAPLLLLMGGRDRGLRQKFRIIILTVFLNLLVWFFTAPDPRFAQGFLFLGFSLVLARGASALLSGFPAPRRAVAWAAFLLLATVFFIKRNQWMPPNGLHTVWVHPHAYPEVRVTSFQGANFTMSVASPETRFCGLTPLPCTPYPRVRLARRGADLRSGFVIIDP